jgi:hypothetical protein
LEHFAVIFDSAMPNPSLVKALAASFLAGEMNVELVAARAMRTLGRRWRWLRPLARRYVTTFRGRVRPASRDVIRFLKSDEGFLHACSEYSQELLVKHWLNRPQRMLPLPAARSWKVPAIESVGALAEWLGITIEELQWFADLKGLRRLKSSPQLRHYHYRILIKRSGAVRLIEAPKMRLKALQKQILTQILNQIPPHPAAHGFRKGRSIKTFAAPHAGKRVVVRMDLRDFFPTIAAGRIQSLFRTAGYPDSVAELLAGICINAAPRDVWEKPGFDIDRALLREARDLYSRPHLPQGAPTSPALANLCAYRVDCRLAGLAPSVEAGYTRYADDLAFSGNEAFEKCVERFSTHVAVILHEEGFSVHHRKTRIMRQGVRQHLAGLVANDHVNIMRADFDRLKATLTNCARLGPEGQNRQAHPRFRAHLDGRVAFVEMINPAKGQRLREIFDRIQWP